MRLERPLDLKARPAAIWVLGRALAIAALALGFGLLGIAVLVVASA